MDGSKLFSTGRPIGSGKTIPLEYRASLEAALAALYYERRAIQLSIAKRPRGGVR